MFTPRKVHSSELHAFRRSTSQPHPDAAEGDETFMLTVGNFPEKKTRAACRGTVGAAATNQRPLPLSGVSNDELASGGVGAD